MERDADRSQAAVGWGVRTSSAWIFNALIPRITAWVFAGKLAVIYL